MRHIDSLWLPHPNFVVHWLQLSGVTVSQLSDVLDCCEAFESGSVGHPAMQETWARKRCPWVVSRLEQESVPPWQEPLVEAQMPQGVARNGFFMGSANTLSCLKTAYHDMARLGFPMLFSFKAAQSSQWRSTIFLESRCKTMVWRSGNSSLHPWSPMIFCQAPFRLWLPRWFVREGRPVHAWRPDALDWSTPWHLTLQVLFGLVQPSLSTCSCPLDLLICVLLWLSLVGFYSSTCSSTW